MKTVTINNKKKKNLKKGKKAVKTIERIYIGKTTSNTIAHLCIVHCVDHYLVIDTIVSLGVLVLDLYIFIY